MHYHQSKCEWTRNIERRQIRKKRLTHDRSENQCVLSAGNMAAGGIYDNHQRIHGVSSRDEGKTTATRTNKRRSHDHPVPRTSTGMDSSGEVRTNYFPHQLQISWSNDRANSLISKQVEPFNWHIPPEGERSHQTLSVLSLPSTQYIRTKRFLRRA